MLAAYRKTVASVVGTFLTWAGAVYVPDGHVTREGWFALAVAAATSLGVYGISNSTPVVPTPVILEPEPSSVKFLDAVPAPVTAPVPLTLVSNVPVTPVTPA
jgi:hypothetical protein